MNYLLDTNIILHFFKKKATKVVSLLEEMDVFGDDHCAMVSIVSIGEIKSIGLRNNWDRYKWNQLEDLIFKLEVIQLSNTIVSKYAEIDQYSNELQPSLNLKSHAYKMGKNDIWIAATASVNQAKLITTDKDFIHLADRFIDLLLLSVKGKYLDADALFDSK